MGFPRVQALGGEKQRACQIENNFSVTSHFQSEALSNTIKMYHGNIVLHKVASQKHKFNMRETYWHLLLELT